MVIHLQPIVSWLLQQAGGFLFSKAAEQVFNRLGFFAASESGMTLTAQRVLFEQYLGQLRDRLDEDRIAKLYGAFSLLGEVRHRVHKQAALEHALAAFHDISGLPESGVTGGMPNSRLRALSFLGIAATHMELKESQELVAKNVVLAFLTDRPVVEPLLGEELSTRLVDGLKQVNVAVPDPRPSAQGVIPPLQPVGGRRPTPSVITTPASTPGKLTRDQIVQAIKNKQAGRLDLCGQDFSGLNLASLDFRPTVLRNVNFQKANLSGAQFGGGIFTEEPDLRGAQLGEANLTGAYLQKAILRRANLTNATLRSADLTRADLRGATLIGADLSEANLHAVRCNKSMSWDGEVPAADMEGAILQGAQVRGNALLQHVNLRGANLSKAQLVGAILEDANLSSAILRQCVLINAKFKDASLEDADLSGANLQGADLRGANLSRAILAGATMKGATYNYGTRWPEGFVPFVAGAVLQS